jgi:predicted metal-dependent hydrolase
MYEYSLKRSGRKTLSLEITGDLNILVRAPMRLSRREIDRFVESRSDWIASHLEKQRLRTEAGLSGELSATEIGFLKGKALAVIPGRVRYYGQLMGLEPAGLRITGAGTRFGSCSGKNRLCFSYKLMLYPRRRWITSWCTNWPISAINTTVRIFMPSLPRYSPITRQGEICSGMSPDHGTAREKRMNLIE